MILTKKIAIKEIVSFIDEDVCLYGWVQSRRDHGKIIFIDLRDKSGIAQIVFSPEKQETYLNATRLKSEWVVKIKGKIKQRPEKMINPKIETGTVEIEAEDLEILSEAKTPVFSIDTDGYDIREDLRLKYRYLDLKRPRLRNNLIWRHKVIKFIRDFLSEQNFIEIETPILTKSTPEGARDYIIPSRLSPGNFYALPQSPQQYKQLLMVAGLEKYFQVARCFRDEDPRGDRQPEFTQLDLELSFPSQEEILNLIEELFISIVKNLFPEKKLKTPFPRITYQEAMQKYQSDKPDLRENKDDPNELACAFIVDFPMFEWKEGDKRWGAVHHPFTRIQNNQSNEKTQEEFISYIKNNIDKLLAHQYDFVLNGFEVGGGSLRESNPSVLTAVFEILGHEKNDIQKRFGHLLDAFECGVPPHGGIALGLDRLVSILLGEPNIREVIAFPKTGDGRDLMMSAPSIADKKQLLELGLTVEKKDK